MGNVQGQLVLQLLSLGEELPVQPQKCILTWHGNLNFVESVPRDSEATGRGFETKLRPLPMYVSLSGTG